MKYLLFSGSLRTASLNKKLIQVTADILTKNTQNSTVVADIRELNIPVYDADIEAKAIPEGVYKLGSLIDAADGLIISSPEYNGSISSPLKNTIDWVSRLKPVPFAKKPILLLGASPGGFGAIRSLGVSRRPLENLKAYVYPEMFALPKAHEAFDEKGQILEQNTINRLSNLLNEYQEFAEKLK